MGPEPTPQLTVPYETPPAWKKDGETAAAGAHTQLLSPGRPQRQDSMDQRMTTWDSVHSSAQLGSSDQQNMTAWNEGVEVLSSPGVH